MPEAAAGEVAHDTGNFPEAPLAEQLPPCTSQKALFQGLLPPGGIVDDSDLDFIESDRKRKDAKQLLEKQRNVGDANGGGLCNGKSHDVDSFDAVLPVLPVLPDDDDDEEGGKHGVRNKLRNRAVSLFDLLAVATAIYAAWLATSSAVTCKDDVSRSPFWWYMLFHAGIWFWLSLICMAAILDIILIRPQTEQAGTLGFTESFGDRGHALWKALLQGTVCAAFGLCAGSLVLYKWHIVDDHKDGGLIPILVSRAIIMSCVGLFGVALLTCASYHRSSSSSSVQTYLRHEGIWPVVLCCMWCIVWLVSEVFSQCFQPFTEEMHRLLPSPIVPIVETAYVELFSVIVLPGMRLLLGGMERYFLLPGNRGVGIDQFTLSIRAINWIDLLFEGFRWMYYRVVFAKVRPETLVISVLSHICISIYTYYWKYSPHRTAARVAYFHSKSRVPPKWSNIFEERPDLRMALRILVRMFRIADAMSSQMFSSTYFILSLSPRHATISFTGTTTYAKTDLTCVATLTVLNHRFNIMQNTQDVPFPAPKPVPLEFTEFLASSASGSPDTDLAPAAAEAAAVEAGKGTDPGMQQTMCWLSNVDAKEAVSFSHELAHAHICCLSLQQHIELRLRSRQCMRLFSSLVLLWTNIVLGAFDSNLVKDPVGPLSKSPVRLLIFPIVMLFSDIVEVCCMWHTYQGWFFSLTAVRQWRRKVVGDPLYLLTQLCIMFHVSMSPTFGRHTSKFCS